MAKIFNDGDEVTKEWLNGVSKTVTDGLGDKVSPGEIRVHINAEQAGTASAVQGNLDSHKADSNLHFPDAPNDTKDYVRGQGTWKISALTEAPLDSETYGRRNGAWSVVSGTGQTDHQTLLNRSAVDSHPAAAITGLSEKHSTYDAHLVNILNPHQVTAAQVDAYTRTQTDSQILDHYQTQPHIPDAPNDGNDYTRKSLGWSLAPGANIEEYSVVTAASAGDVAADVNATDFTGHAYAGANTYVTVESNHALTIVHGTNLFKYIGTKPVNLGVGGATTVVSDYLQVGSSDHTALANRDAVGSHPQAAITDLVTDLAGKASSTHNHSGTYDPAGTASTEAGAVQTKLDTHAALTDQHIGHATSDTNAYVSIDGAWGLLNDNITLPAAETDHTKLTNKNQPFQHSIGSIGYEGGRILDDVLDDMDDAIALKATSAALSSHAGDATIHWSDAKDALQYVRTKGAWVKYTSSGGDLKSDFSVQMVGTPLLGQDIATKTSSEAVFTDRLRGYNASGYINHNGEDLDTLLQGDWYVTMADANIPDDMQNGSILHARSRLGGDCIQTIEAPFNGAYWRTRIFKRRRYSGVWTVWKNSQDAEQHLYDNTASAYNATTVQEAIDEIAVKTDSYDDSLVDAYPSHTTPSVQYRFRTKTQTEYDSILGAGSIRDDTIYFIIG